MNYDDSVLYTTNVIQGQTAVYVGSTPTRPNTNQFTYTFTGWDRTLTNITSAFTTKAQFSTTTNTYTVTWQNHDGTTLETDTNVSYGTTPAYNGVTPVRTGSAQYSYSFTGWSPSIASVTTNITYTAQFAQSTNTYTVIWQNHDGTILETDNNVSYGTTPGFNGANPTKTSTDDYDYPFTGWLPAIASVTANVTYVAQFTENLNYIPITNAQDLNNIRNNLSANYRLMNDIDLAGIEWTPIGSGSTPFTGTLDGKEFIIFNLTITQPNPYIGFFSHNSGIIKNLIFENIQITISNGSSFSIGALAGYSNGTVENLTLTSGDITISHSTNYVGSLVGTQFNGSIKIIESNLNLTTNNSLFTGGIIGFASNSSTIESNLISNLIFSGELTVEQGNVGGLISRTDGQYLIENSNNFADINRTRPSISIVGSTKNVGGLVGQANGNITINHSNNKGYIESGFGNVGGLIGYLASTSVSLISNSSNSGNINSIGGNVGGLIGIEDSGSVNAIITIINSINFGVIVGNDNVGGLIGLVKRHSEINTSSNEGIISGQASNIGGLIGNGIRTIAISNSVNNGNLLGWASMGGLIGRGDSSISINYSVNNGQIDAFSNKIGGLVGWVTFANSLLFIMITNSMNSGSLSGTSRVGGLMGYAENLNQIFVDYSVNLGNVVAINSTTDVGGIAGFLPATNNIEQTYHYGSITSNGVEVAGTNFGTKVTDVSTFNIAFFTTTLEWDTEIWDFTGLNIANGVYPTLKNMPVVED